MQFLKYPDMILGPNVVGALRHGEIMGVPTLDLIILDQRLIVNPTRVHCNIESLVANHNVPGIMP